MEAILSINKSDPNYLDINILLRDIDKEKSLSYALENIFQMNDNDTLIVAGNDFLDLKMLNKATYGITPKNSILDVNLGTLPILESCRQDGLMVTKDEKLMAGEQIAQIAMSIVKSKEKEQGLTSEDIKELPLSLTQRRKFRDDFKDPKKENVELTIPVTRQRTNHCGNLQKL
jgi:hypothetical protein